MRFRFFTFCHGVSLNLIAYTLCDCGASGSFISSEFLDRCCQNHWRIPFRQTDPIDVMTAGALEERDGLSVFLTIKMGSFWQSQSFTVYPLVGYDLILGKDFMETVPQGVDLPTNILYLPNTKLKGLEKFDRDRNGPATEAVEATPDYLRNRQPYWEAEGAVDYRPEETGESYETP
jgi:hypothetical protein